jgi:hypothetical protein
MAARLNGDALRWLAALHCEGSLGRMSDGHWLEGFLARDGSTSEAKFEVLVRRHGPVVLCRRRAPRLPRGTRQILIAPQIDSPGTVWIDELEAAYTNDPKTDPIAS